MTTKEWKDEKVRLIGGTHLQTGEVIIAWLQNQNPGAK